MESSHSGAATIEVDTVGFRVNPLDHPELDNIVVSPCGTCIESFDYKGNHFVIDWDELVGEPDEEEIPHEQVMEEMRLYVEELVARREAGR
ncbi:MAG: hypothetical protein WDO68_03095 [Gammaproteobacteria bacterium]